MTGEGAASVVPVSSVVPVASVTTAEQPGALMRAEIGEQPARWVELVSSQRDAWARAIRLVRDARPEMLAFVARGSSDHAAIFGQYLVHSVLRIPAMLTTPSTHTVFDTAPVFPRGLQLALSQSGMSPDLVATARDLRGAGLPLVAMTNDSASDLARLADAAIHLAAGPERSVAATKSYTAELLAVRTLVHGAAGADLDQLDADLASAAAAAEQVLSRATDFVAESLAQLVEFDRVVLVGRGLSMSSAKEGALKLMETSGVAASGWSAADATHGPLGQVNAETLVVAFTASPAGRDSVVDFAAAAQARGASVLEIGAAATVDPRWSFSISTDLPDDLLPALEILPIQVLAAETSIARGMDPDRPAGLRKVTLTT